MDNIILGYHNKRMNVEHFECLVGGLPVVRTWPYEYKAPFSPIDVLEEYTRPARYVENSCIVTKPALSDAELIKLTDTLDPATTTLPDARVESPLFASGPHLRVWRSCSLHGLRRRE